MWTWRLLIHNNKTQKCNSNSINGTFYSGTIIFLFKTAIFQVSEKTMWFCQKKKLKNHIVYFHKKQYSNIIILYSLSTKYFMHRMCTSLYKMWYWYQQYQYYKKWKVSIKIITENVYNTFVKLWEWVRINLSKQNKTI